ADTLARAFGSVETVVGLPAGATETQPPPYVTSRALLRLYVWRARLLRALSWIWPIGLAAALVLISLQRFGRAIPFGLLCVYFTAYPAIQFNDRHVLHLELIPLAGLLFVCDALRRGRWRGPVRQAVVFAGAAIVCLIAPLAVARVYQQRHMTALLE